MHTKTVWKIQPVLVDSLPYELKIGTDKVLPWLMFFVGSKNKKGMHARNVCHCLGTISVIFPTFVTPRVLPHKHQTTIQYICIHIYIYVICSILEKLFSFFNLEYVPKQGGFMWKVEYMPPCRLLDEYFSITWVSMNIAYLFGTPKHLCYIPVPTDI